MTGSITLINNADFASDAITFTATGSQTFAYSLPSGREYGVTVSNHNSDEVCILPDDNTGFISSDTTITVTCTGATRNYFFSNIF